MMSRCLSRSCLYRSICARSSPRACRSRSRSATRDSYSSRMRSCSTWTARWNAGVSSTFFPPTRSCEPIVAIRSAERLAKRQLEERIATMGSQLLVGGKKVEDTPAFHRAVQVEHERIREEYESRVADLERERHALGEDRAQIDRYKQLLLKQRDIMIALTGRLNERDASILALQEELDAYDSHQRMMEDALDNKTAMLIRLQQGTPGGPDADGNMGGGGGGGGGMGMGMDAARTYEPEIDGPEAQVVFEGGRGTPSNGGPKLSAHEKVSELGGLLATSRGDVEAISRELEDLRAEKVSLEYLLRERLEKMVAAEVRERIEAYKADVGGGSAAGSEDLRDEIARLRDDLAKAQAQVHALRDRTGGNSSPGAARQHAQMQQSMHAERAKLVELEARLRDEAEARYEAEERARQLEAQNRELAAPRASDAERQNETLLKERQAIKIIMEKKIKALVDSISSGTRDSRGTAKDIATLQKLVNASIAALKSSAV
eukprot:TRINITY_DN4279_c0_g2_i1.p1 TRINITY_DN4279_c0_g2~~TRINITY_DN4279_c0_g2_i1.p1  ORF type:complete len:490 (+),score=197.20 TRINITY_DN4279_c0_g2_i1:1077-2546(+)